MKTATDHLKILRVPAVTERVSICRSTLYDWISEKSPRFDSTFPKPVKIGPSAVGWIESEINEWIKSKMNAQK
jgi:prophage regulatory protein